MNIYTIKVPLVIESKGNYDKYDFSSSEKLEFNYSNKDEEFSYELKSSEEESYIIFNEIQSLNLDNCMNRVESFLNTLLPLCSLIIQSKHSNQHYSHIRLNYQISNASIVSEKALTHSKMKENIIQVSDNIGIRESLNIQSTLYVDFSDLNLYMDMKSDMNFIYLIHCYYRAIAATDAITKYYNAFTAIEFIENYFKNDIATTKLLNDDELNNIDQYIKNTISDDRKDRISGRLKSTLKSATFESRTQKLTLIINNIFKISKLNSKIMNIKIDEEFISSMIKTRNLLFHGKQLSNNDKDEISNKSLNLIYLLQDVLVNWKLIKT